MNKRAFIAINRRHWTAYVRWNYSLTHSLVDLPRWGLATADDHSDNFLLHCARSCDISFSWMYSQPVHSSMSCIHCLLDLPWCRNPSMILSRTVNANCPALLPVIWPKYCSFSFATLSVNSLFRPNSVNIESFVWCSCHEMLSIFLQLHISKASILFLSDFFKVHPSTPYWNTAHTIDFITLTFVAVFIFLFFQILASTTAFCLANTMRLLISLVQSYQKLQLSWKDDLHVRVKLWAVGGLSLYRWRLTADKRRCSRLHDDCQIYL